ncbi:trypsin-like peptidase domain-containing protein [Nonomuraea wenchangensis]|uniref:nSTAND1 domain-containing NTPase n=1 Tax=Nonomuraea wenchangensis TaxID=568860 RepID=UPI00371A08CC
MLALGVVGFMAGALPVPDWLLDRWDKQSSVISMLIGGVTMALTVMAMRRDGRRNTPSPSQVAGVASSPSPMSEPSPFPRGAGNAEVDRPRSGTRKEARGARLGLSAARVRGPAGVAGGGCLVGARDVVTCAHVVSGALGLRDADYPGEPVLVDFPLLGRAHQPITAEVVAWDGAADVAVLRLAEPPPEGAQPARPVTADDYWGHSFRVLGFPRGRADSGVWASGRLLGRRGDGWLQVENPGRGGHGFRPGFSGATVWDEELNAPIGILVAGNSGHAARTAYVIPANVLLRGLPDLAAQATAPAPYRGLEAFREGDAGVFFGRLKEIRDLLDRSSRPRVTVVYGPSGSGKSSLVMAGLLPRLREKAGVCVITVRPAHGRTPVFALAAALLPALEPERGETSRMAELPGLAQVLAEGGIVEVVQRVRTRTGADEFVLVIDQFEEVFTSAHPAEEFVSALLPLLRTAAAGAHTVMTVRVDYSDRLLDQLRTADLQQEVLYPVMPLDRDRLREAIEGPAHERGVMFQADLVERILDDVGDEPGRLPLVEFALTMLWDRQSGGVLSHDAYREIEGAAGALAAYAEQVWNEQLSPADHPRVRSLLLQLVRQAPDHDPSCAVLSQEALSEEQWRLGQELATTRLLVAAEDRQGVRTLRLAHESLISRWGRLSEWVRADRDFRTWHHELRRAFERWSAERETDRLLRGTDLATARRWLDVRHDDLRPAERAFVEASSHRSAQIRRRRQAMGTAVVVLLIVSLVSGVQIYRGHLAEQEKLRTSAAQTLAGRAEEDQENPDLAILEAVAAYRSDPGAPKVERALFNRYSDFASADRLLAGSGVTSQRLLAAEDGGVITQEESHGVKIWQPDHRSALPKQIALSSPVAGTALSADGRVLAIAAEDGSVELWHPREHRLLDKLPIPKGKALLALDPAGRQLAVQPADSRTVQVWDLRRRQARSVSLPGQAQTLQVAEDGLLSVSLGDHRLLVFEPGQSRSARTVPASAVFAHDGTTAAGCVPTRDGIRVRGVDLRTGASIADFPLTFRGCEGNVSRPGTLSHGGRLLSVENVLIDLRAGRIIGAPAGYADAPAVTGRDDRWSIWTVGGPGLVRFPVARTLDTDPHEVLESAVTGDGGHIVTYDGDGRLRVWDAASKLLVNERPAASNSGSGTEVATRVVALTGRREIAVIRADSRDLVVMSVPDLRPIGSARLPAGSDGQAPLSLHAVAGGRLVVFARGVLTVWETTPLRQTAPGLDLRERLSALSPQEVDQGLDVLPNVDGNAALVIEGTARKVERWDLTLGRATGNHLIPGSGELVPVAASPDLTRLITYTATVEKPFTAWSLPTSGQPVPAEPQGPTDGHAFDLLQLLRSNPELRYNASFSISRLGDSLGYLTLFGEGGKLLYRTDEARIMSTAPQDWAAHLCAILGGRSFTSAELARLPQGADPMPCEHR